MRTQIKRALSRGSHDDDWRLRLSSRRGIDLHAGRRALMGSLATTGGYPGVAPFDEDDAKHRRQLAVVANNLLLGKSNNTGTLTLMANVATTTLTDSRIGANSTILLHPTTANAAAAMATTYFSAFL